MAKFTAVAKVKDVLVAEAELLCALGSCKAVNADARRCPRR
jgi:hypothetical protein